MIRNGGDEYLIWWREESKQILRVVTLCRYSTEVRISFANDQPHQPIYHESFRYIRLAQITDDLFDAYRNMYLALELLVSTISSKARQESERNWLKRVIGSSPDYCTERRIVEEIYKVRCDLFHAKKNEMYILPQKSLDDRKRVSDSLNHLSVLVFKMLRKLHNVGRQTGWSLSSINEYYIEQSEKIFIILSDDDTLFDANETIDSPTFKNSVRMTTRYDYDLSEKNWLFWVHGDKHS